MAVECLLHSLSVAAEAAIAAALVLLVLLAPKSQVHLILCYSVVNFFAQNKLLNIEDTSGADSTGLYTDFTYIFVVAKVNYIRKKTTLFLLTY